MGLEVARVAGMASPVLTLAMSYCGIPRKVSLDVRTQK